MKIFIKDKKRRREEFQFFMHDFIDACKLAGFKTKRDIVPDYKWHYRAMLREVCYHTYIYIYKYLPWLLRRKKALIIAANGYTIKDIAFPYYGCYEIIPFLWDCWPSSWLIMLKAFSEFEIKKVFVSSSQVAERINNETSVEAIYVPEGIDIQHYKKGKYLCERNVDVFEMGRQMPEYHKLLTDLHDDGNIKELRNSNITPMGALNDKSVAYTNNELYDLLADTKILICFPHCDTNKDKAGNIETLTQRYWEGMLSRCLMVGRAPKELIDLIGYNPVIDIEWNSPKEQILSLLSNISKYQDLVERNHEAARKYASWEHRIDILKEKLIGMGYSI